MRGYHGRLSAYRRALDLSTVNRVKRIQARLSASRQLGRAERSSRRSTELPDESKDRIASAGREQPAHDLQSHVQARTEVRAARLVGSGYFARPANPGVSMS